MKINLQITLNKEDQNDLKIYESLESFTLAYNMMQMMSEHTLPELQSEVCDNNDGTVEFRIIDFELDNECIEEFKKCNEEMMNNLPNMMFGG